MRFRVVSVMPGGDSAGRDEVPQVRLVPARPGDMAGLNEGV